MKKIIIITFATASLALGILAAANAQGEWEWIDTGFDYILYDMSFPEGQSQTGFAVGSTSTYNGDGIILRTTDSGYTWEQISDPAIPGLEAAFFSDLNTGYVAGWDGYFARTTDGGITWEEITVNAGIWYFVDLEFWDNNNGIAAAWADELYVTDDAGETWTQATGVTAGVHDLCYASSDVLYAACGDEKILKSTDGGLSWTEIYAGIFTYVFTGVEFLDENYGMVGGEDGKVLITNDGGATWTTNNTSNFHLWHGFHLFNEDSAYVTGTPEGVYKTTDGGITWVDDYPQSTYNAAFYKILFTPDNNTGFVCGSQGTIMRKEGTATSPSVSVTPEAIIYPQTWVGETTEYPLTVSNSGSASLTVTDISSDNPAFYADLTSFNVEPGMDQEVMIIFEPGDEGLFEGILSVASNDPLNPVVEVEVQGEGLIQQPVISHPGELAFDTTLVYNSSSVLLVIWNIGNADLEVSDIEVSNEVFSADMTGFTVLPGDSAVVTVTFSPMEEGTYEATLQVTSNDESSPTTVDLMAYAELGTGMTSYQSGPEIISAYPNPFNDEVKIHFQSGSHAQDVLKVYNLFGGLVKELSPDHSAGKGSIYIWDGTNGAGEQVPSGIYFGIIEAPGLERSIKIIRR